MKASDAEVQSPHFVFNSKNGVVGKGGIITQTLGSEMTLELRGRRMKSSEYAAKEMNLEIQRHTYVVAGGWCNALYVQS